MKKVTANGLEFSYLEEGTGPLIIFLHGFPDNAWTWNEILPKVAAANYRCVALFTRGYFPSQIAPNCDYSAETLAEDVFAVIEALGEKQAVIVGHDWGAMTGYAAANIDRSKINKLVTLGLPHPRIIHLSIKLLKRAPHFIIFQFGWLAEWLVAFVECTGIKTCRD